MLLNRFVCVAIFFTKLFSFKSFKKFDNGFMHFHCGDPVIGNFSLSEHAGIFKVSIFKRRKAVKVFSLAKLGAPPPPVSLHHHPHHLSQALHQ